MKSFLLKLALRVPFLRRWAVRRALKPLERLGIVPGFDRGGGAVMPRTVNEQAADTMRARLHSARPVLCVHCGIVLVYGGPPFLCADCRNCERCAPTVRAALANHERHERERRGSDDAPR